MTAKVWAILGLAATAMAALVSISAPLMAAEGDGSTGLTTGEAAGEIGGRRLSRAEAAAGIGVVRWALESYDKDRALQTAPSSDALVHQFTERLAQKWPLKEEPPKVLSEKRRMQVFITLYAPKGSDLSAEGRGTTLAAALVDGAANLLKSPRYRTEGFNQPAMVRVALDVTIYSLPYMQNLAEPFLYSMRAGVDGLVYENGNQKGLVLPWEAERRAWDMHFTRQGEKPIEETKPARDAEEVKRALFRSLLDRAGAQAATWRGPAARVLRFEVQSFIESAAGGSAGLAAGGKGDVVELYRTGPLVRAESLVDDDVARAVALAADYLARTPDKNGVVRQSYDPLRNAWAEDTDPGRQALAVQAFMRRYESHKEPWLLKAGTTLAAELVKGLKTLDKVKGSDGAERNCAFAAVGSKAELTWTAQTLVALADLQAGQPDSDRPALIARLTNTLAGAQKKNGSFNIYFAPGTDESTMKKDEEDLSGASVPLLALVRAYDVLKTEDLLKRARSAADYLVFQREKLLGRAEPQGLSDPCLIEALSALDRHLANDGYVKYAAQCLQAMAEAQIVDPSRYPLDEIGGFANGAYSEADRTAFSLRGLRAGARLLKRIETDTPERFKKLDLQLAADVTAKARRRAEACLLSLQYTEVNAFYLSEPAVAVGGLRYSAYDDRISTVSVVNFVLAESP